MTDHPSIETLDDPARMALLGSHDAAAADEVLHDVVANVRRGRGTGT